MVGAYAGRLLHAVEQLASTSNDRRPGDTCESVIIVEQPTTGETHLANDLQQIHLFRVH